MGYYKNLEVELQDITDQELFQIVAWDRAHRELLTPEERWKILTNEILLKRALVLWENGETPAPKPASEHVALWEDLVPVPRPQRFVSKMAIFGWSLVVVALGAGVAVLVVNL
jgi:hypothetical protein